MRQDPNIIFIGEIRDRESIFTGLQAAETGHLVFTTLHADSTAQAIARIHEFLSGGGAKQRQQHAGSQPEYGGVSAAHSRHPGNAGPLLWKSCGAIARSSKRSKPTSSTG